MVFSHTDGYRSLEISCLLIKPVLQILLMFFLFLPIFQISFFPGNANFNSRTETTNHYEMPLPLITTLKESYRTLKVKSCSFFISRSYKYIKRGKLLSLVFADAKLTHCHCFMCASYCFCLPFIWVFSPLYYPVSHN